jgi:hypothetical protein
MQVHSSYLAGPQAAIPVVGHAVPGRPAGSLANPPGNHVRPRFRVL